MIKCQYIEPEKGLAFGLIPMNVGKNHSGWTSLRFKPLQDTMPATNK